MATAKDLLRGRIMGEVFSIHPVTSVQEALAQLSEHNVGALLVVDAGGEVVGILSERDIVRKVGLLGKTAEATRVGEIMTGKVFFVNASQTVEECMAMMNEKSIRHLPVYENGTLLGMISIRDVLRTVISEQQNLLTHLEQYIRRG